MEVGKDASLAVLCKWGITENTGATYVMSGGGGGSMSSVPGTGRGEVGS